jgi:hypothetical protein
MARKLTDTQVRAIRHRYYYHEDTMASLAAAFAVAPETIASVVRGRTYQDVPRQVSPGGEVVS